MMARSVQLPYQRTQLFVLTHKPRSKQNKIFVPLKVLEAQFKKLRLTILFASSFQHFVIRVVEEQLY